jgi:hypothetical protein
MNLIIGFLATLGIGGTLGALISWQIEKRRGLRDRRSALIADWRQLVADTLEHGATNDQSALKYLETQPAYYSLKPHVKGPLCSGATSMRTVSDGIPQSALPETLNTLINEIAGLRKSGS